MLLNADPEYNDSFFLIDLKQKCTKEQQFSDKSQFSTLLHEYIHYLQNVLSICGINNTNNLLQIYMEYIIELRTSPTQLTIPINIDTSKTITYCSYENFLAGDPITYIKQFSELSCEPELQTQDINGKSEEFFYLSFKNSFSDIKLGNPHLYEFMAIMSENYIFNLVTPEIRETQYNLYYSLQSVINFYCPELLNHKLFVIALCELSLCDSFCSVQFIKLLQNLKKWDFSKISLENYKEKILELFFDINSCDRKSIVDQYVSISKETLEKFTKDFFVDTSLNDERNWVLEVFRNGSIYKNTTNFFPITDFLFKFKRAKNKVSFFVNFVSNKIPMPLLVYNDTTNILNVGCLKDASTRFSTFKNIFYHISDIDVSKSSECKCILSSCCDYKEPICEIEPFKRGLINDVYLCNYCHMWKALHLPDYLSFKNP